MLSAAFDDNLQQLSREKKRTKAIDGTKSVLDRIIESIEKTIDKAGRSASNIKGLGIGEPKMPRLVLDVGRPVAEQFVQELPSQGFRLHHG